MINVVVEMLKKKHLHFFRHETPATKAFNGINRSSFSYKLYSSKQFFFVNENYKGIRFFPVAQGIYFPRNIRGDFFPVIQLKLNRFFFFVSSRPFVLDVQRRYR